MNNTRARAKLSVRLYPWYSALSLDLIFYVVFNAIWLIDIKGFDAAQVTFLSTISGISAIIFQAPVLHLAKRLGNTRSIRVGALALLLCSIMITFSETYFGFVAAQVCFIISNLFSATGDVLIKNDLEYLRKGHQYAKLASKACVIYSSLTMIASILIGAIFSCWEYLPMILGIITCTIPLILSFCIEDVSERTKSAPARRNVPSARGSFPKPAKLFIHLLVFYALVYGIIATAQTDGKLFVQAQLSAELDADDVVTIYGIIIFVSRVSRLVGNLIYARVYRRLRDRVVVLFPTLALAAISLILLGFSLDIEFYLKIILMAAGLSILLALRDPFKIYNRDLCLRVFPKTQQRDAMLYLQTAHRCGELAISGLASAILLHAPLEYVFLSCSVLIIPVIFYGLYIKRIFRQTRRVKA